MVRTRVVLPSTPYSVVDGTRRRGGVEHTRIGDERSKINKIKNKIYDLQIVEQGFWIWVFLNQDFTSKLGSADRWGWAVWPAGRFGLGVDPSDLSHPRSSTQFGEKPRSLWNIER